jgi:uncharacterized membrane protein
VKLFSWAAGLALAVAGLTFAKYAVDSGMLGPGLRFLLGLLAGVGLLIVCELKVARRYAPTANARSTRAGLSSCSPRSTRGMPRGTSSAP